MKVLVINAGSSSLKYQLIDMTTNVLMAKGQCERIGIDGGIFKHSANGKEDYTRNVNMENHAKAIELVIEALLDSEHGVISSMSEISAVGHRVLHGGEKFSGSVFIDDKVMEAIEECIELGPLHNPHNLTGIRACAKVMQGVPQVAVFDTGFHATMPKVAFMYALPYEYYEKYHIRRYGFHGTSHRYVSAKAAKFLGKDINNLKIVTCHLGNGSSIAAVKNGKCVDTSMGLTPLEGLMMGTRCGNIDPAIIPLMMEKENLSTRDIDDVMNKKSGVLGITGVSSDFRDVEALWDEGNERAGLALQMFCYQITKYIGSYAAAMGGIDVLVFTAGIGENNGRLRKIICENLAFMGIILDDEKNKQRGKECDLSAENATVKTVLIPTNEELTIAIDTVEVLENLKK
ncbi:MAG: acetate kinase [Clostridia bacterium]